MSLVVHGDLDAAVRQRLGVQALRDAGELEDVDCPLLQHAGAYAPEHVLGRALLEDHGIDACPMKQLPEQQARGSSADDDDLGSHAGHAGRRAAG